MGPKMQEIEIKYNIENAVIQCALPYNKAEYQKAEYQKAEEKPTDPERSENGWVRSAPSTAHEVSEGVDPLRVSTRARFSYELDRYSKNAMLIFEGNASDIAFEYSAEETPPHADDMSTKFKHTFEKFRFEVNVYRNLTDEEIATTCERFFQRDFTEYGCVAVMMLAKTTDGVVESSHTPNSEFGVMRYMSDLMPPTLQDKPKIYIVQTEDFYVIPRARVWSTFPRDNLEFRLAVPIASSPDARGRRSKIYCLLERIYEKINSLGDQTDLHTILRDASEEYARTSEFSVVPGFYSTLTKELRFVRTPEP